MSLGLDRGWPAGLKSGFGGIDGERGRDAGEVKVNSFLKHGHGDFTLLSFFVVLRHLVGAFDVCGQSLHFSCHFPAAP